MPDAGTARALLAGLIAGVTGAFATTAVALVAMAGDERWRARSAGARVPLPLLGVLFVNGLMLAWTLLGLLLAAAYLRADSAGLFAVLIALAVAVALLLAGYARGRITRPMAATALVALLAFGGLLPALAG